MITVRELKIYPVKSLAGLPLQQHSINQYGFCYDREWMITDEQGMFITQREFPQLALVQPFIDDEFLSLTYNNKTVCIPLKSTSATHRSVQVWDDIVNAMDEGHTAAEFMSSILEKPCSVVRMSKTTKRFIDEKYSAKQDRVHFGDAMPFHVINTTSLDELNSRLDEPVSSDRFRANIMISGTTPYNEDTWKNIRIGDIEFTVPKTTSRCMITTINQQTAQTGKEPLRTLSLYRTMDSRTLFGIYLIHKQKYGIIRVGDVVEVL